MMEHNDVTKIRDVSGVRVLMYGPGRSFFTWYERGVNKGSLKASAQDRLALAFALLIGLFGDPVDVWPKIQAFATGSTFALESFSTAVLKMVTQMVSEREQAMDVMKEMTGSLATLESAILLQSKDFHSLKLRFKNGRWGIKMYVKGKKGKKLLKKSSSATLFSAFQALFSQPVRPLVEGSAEPGGLKNGE